MHEILISVTATGDCGPQRPYVPPTKSHSFKQPCICMFHRLDVYTLQSSTACHVSNQIFYYRISC